MRPRGKPPTPRAKSMAIEPEGTTSNDIRSWISPMRIIEPLPNCRSICASALFRAACRSSCAAIAYLFSCESAYVLFITLTGGRANTLSFTFLKFAVFEERVDKLRLDEGPQILDPFAQADEFDRHLDRVDDGDEDAALCRGVEFGHDRARQRGRIVEKARLRDRVLSRGAVENEQCLRGGAAGLALDHAAHLLQLFHQVGLGLEPARRVDDDDVGASRFARLHAVEDDRRRIGAFLSPYEVRAGAYGPDCELFGGGCAKRVGRDEHDAFAFSDQAGRELADRRRFAASVHADDEQHRGFRGKVQLRAGKGEKPLHVFAETRDDLVAGAPQLLLCDGLEAADDLLGRRHPEVGQQKQLFELVPEFGRNGPLRAPQGLDARKRVACPPERGADLGEEAHGGDAFPILNRTPVRSATRTERLTGVCALWAPRPPYGRHVAPPCACRQAPIVLAPERMGPPA